MIRKKGIIYFVLASYIPNSEADVLVLHSFNIEPCTQYEEENSNHEHFALIYD
jgi:hypothetical protein